MRISLTVYSAAILTSLYSVPTLAMDPASADPAGNTPLILAANDDGDALSSIERAILKAAGKDVAESASSGQDTAAPPTPAGPPPVVVAEEPVAPPPAPEIEITTAPMVSAPSTSAADVSQDPAFMFIQQAVSQATQEEESEAGGAPANSLTSKLNEEATETQLIQQAIQGFSATISDTADPYLNTLSAEADDEDNAAAAASVTVNPTEPEPDVDLNATFQAPAPTPTARVAAPPPKIPILQEETTSQSMITVKPGDSLSSIAVRLYGDAQAYQRLFDANRDIIKDVNHIYPGLKLRLPAR